MIIMILHFFYLLDAIQIKSPTILYFVFYLLNYCVEFYVAI